MLPQPHVPAARRVPRAALAAALVVALAVPAAAPAKPAGPADGHHRPSAGEAGELVVRDGATVGVAAAAGAALAAAVGAALAVSYGGAPRRAEL